MDPYKYIKNRIPGLGIYPVVEGGKEYFRLQFGQPSNISPDYKGNSDQRLIPTSKNQRFIQLLRKNLN